MKKVLCAVLFAFTLGIFIPSADAKPARATVVKIHKKHRKHHHHHHRHHRHHHHKKIIL